MQAQKTGPKLVKLASSKSTIYLHSVHFSYHINGKFPQTPWSLFLNITFCFVLVISNDVVSFLFISASPSLPPSLLSSPHRSLVMFSLFSRSPSVRAECEPSAYRPGLNHAAFYYLRLPSHLLLSLLFSYLLIPCNLFPSRITLTSHFLCDPPWKAFSIYLENLDRC